MSGMRRNSAPLHKLRGACKTADAAIWPTQLLEDHQPRGFAANRSGKRCRASLILIRPRLPHTRHLPERVLIDHEHPANALRPLRALNDVVVANLHPEPRRVERIHEAQCDRRVVAIQLLPHREVHVLHRVELATLDLHRRAIEVVRLNQERRRDLRRRVEPRRPCDRVRSNDALRATVRHHLEQIEAREAAQLRTEAQRTVQVRPPRVARRQIVERDRRNLPTVDVIGGVDLHTNDVRRVAIEGRQLKTATLPGPREPELERVGVLWAEIRIADEDVLDVEERGERVELLSPRTADAARIADLRLVSLSRVPAYHTTREDAGIPIRIAGRRTGETKVAVRLLGAQTSLKVERPRSLT